MPNYGEPNFEASTIGIVEREEPLVDLAELGFVCIPVYHHYGWASSPKLYVRSSVAQKLMRIQREVLLPRDVCWLVWDAWRSRQTQAAIYQHYWRECSSRELFPQPEAVELATQNYVSLPDDLDYAPPHTTGGSVDLGLWDLARDKPVDLGADFDEFTSAAWPRTFEKEPLDGRQVAVRNWRRLMTSALTSEGFVGHPREYFHFDFGNQRWAERTCAPIAQYGEILSVTEVPTAKNPHASVALHRTDVSDELFKRWVSDIREGIDRSHPAKVGASPLLEPERIALGYSRNADAHARSGEFPALRGKPVNPPTLEGQLRTAAIASLAATLDSQPGSALDSVDPMDLAAHCGDIGSGLQD